MDFYDAAFTPPKDDVDYIPSEIPGLNSTLFPYQKRTLKWLLRREGVRWSEVRQQLEALSEEDMDTAIDMFREESDMSGSRIYVSDLLQIVTRDFTHFQRVQTAVKGGILSGKMVKYPLEYSPKLRLSYMSVYTTRLGEGRMLKSLEIWLWRDWK